MMKETNIIVCGDLLPSGNNVELFKKGDAESLFGKEILQLFADADFSIANLEGPLTDSNIAQQKDGPCIKAPKSAIAGIKKLGVSAVALANNHITDYLQQGIDDTIDTLKGAKIGYVGIIDRNNCDYSKGNKFLGLTIGGLKICIYNVSETFFNRPTKEMMGANVYDEWLVLNEIRNLKQKYDYVIVLYHGGAEFLQYPSPQTRKRFHRMAECGADFITSQHTHCIGCEEWYNGSYLLYGQGNFLFARQQKYLSLTKQGLITEIKLSKERLKVVNHIVNIEGNILRYDKDQDFTTFIERSNRVDDEEYIIDIYKKLKTEKTMRKLLLAAKGNYPLKRITKYLFPQEYRHPDTTYNLEQMLRNYNVLQGDRLREDMYYIWQYLIENFKK